MAMLSLLVLNKSAFINNYIGNGFNYDAIWGRWDGVDGTILSKIGLF